MGAAGVGGGGGSWGGGRVMHAPCSEGQENQVVPITRFDLRSNNPVVKCPLLIVSKVNKARY